MKVPLWNTKGLRSKVKSPINKEEITFTCCQGPVPQKDWCSHIKSAPWKVLLKLYECQLYRWFFTLSLLCFTLRACSMVLSGYWYWNFCLVCWFSHLKKNMHLSFFSFKYILSFLFSFLFSSYSQEVCCSLFVVCAIIHKSRAFFWQPLKQEMRNDLHSLAPLHFHSALLLWNTTHRHIHKLTQWHAHMYILTCTHSQMICEDSTILKYWFFFSISKLWQKSKSRRLWLIESGAKGN